MARFKVTGQSAQYLIKLEKLYGETEEMIKKAIQAGAGVVADEIRKNMEGLPTKNDWQERQKQGLKDSFGISPIKKDHGEYNAKIGFEGYNDCKTNQYPNGQPNAMIARSWEKGTSYQQRHPFVELAVDKTLTQAQDAMQKVIDNVTAKIME